MLWKIGLILSFMSYGFAYYTLPGKCPDIKLKGEFKLAEFLGTWYQVGHYSSDSRQSNCSVIDLTTKKDGIYMKLTRVESGIFKRYSEGKIGIPSKLKDGAFLEFKTEDPMAARRVSKRTYPFWIIATNYNYYAVAYTCQYSELIDRHYVYTWLLSRTKSLNAVSKSLALDAAKSITGITSTQFLDDSLNEGCDALEKAVKEEDSRSDSHPPFNFPVIL